MNKLVVYIAINVIGIYANVFNYGTNAEKFITQKGAGVVHSSQIGTGVSISSIWPEGFLYTVDSVNRSAEQKNIYSLFRSVCPESECTHTPMPGGQAIAIKRDSVSQPPKIPVKDSVSVITYINGIVNSLQSKYPIELHTIGFVFEEDSIAEAVVFLRRVMDNGMFLDHSNFIQFTMNTNKIITEINARWINYKKGSDQYPMLSPSEAKTLLESTLLGKYSQAVSSPEVVQAITLYEITGVSNSWATIKTKEGSFKLSPAYSYLVTFTREDGAKRTESVIIPLLKE